MTDTITSEKQLTEDEAALRKLGSGYESMYGFHDDDVTYVYRAEDGLSAELITELSQARNEPDWMRALRLHAYDLFRAKPLPDWGPDLSAIADHDFSYYARATKEAAESWEDVPDPIRDTFDRLHVTEAEQDQLQALSAQYDSAAVYNHVSEKLEQQGVLFMDTDTALRRFPDLMREYFGTVVTPDEHKYTALNTAVWSGGTFIYVPEGVTVEMPLHAYYRLNTEGMGHFERTLIIVERGASVHFVEGCTAPIYGTDSLHSGVVEIIAKEDAHVRLTAIQNWSSDVYNLATVRALAERNATIEFVEGGIGSQTTMKYPSVILNGEGAHAEVLAISFAGRGQHQDAGCKIYHNAPRTSSKVISKSISKDGGRAVYRGLVRAAEHATNCKSNVACDSLLLDDHSRSDTYPTIEVDERQMQIGHEASVTRLGEAQLFYLMSRGLNEAEASALIVNGFIEPFIKQLPLVYARELNQLINIQLEGSIG